MEDRVETLPQSSDGVKNYEIKQLLGHGGSSEVYLAICKKGRLRGREVAIKMTPISSLSNPNHLSHYVRSTRLHETLHHPSIVSLLSQFSTSTHYYQVLEHCAHGPLSSFLNDTGPLSEAEARAVLRPLIEGLVYLSKDHIVHRDIKADNILVTSDFRIKLADFGLATKLLPPAFESKTFCGTPNYLSPEMIARSPYGFESDIWSLGCLVITLLTGTPPFQAATVEETLSQARDAPYVLPSSLSFEAKDFISGLLQTTPHHRIPLRRILSHPFFNPSLPSTPLNRPPVTVGSEKTPPRHTWRSPRKEKENMAPETAYLMSPAATQAPLAHRKILGAVHNAVRPLPRPRRSSSIRPQESTSFETKNDHHGTIKPTSPSRTPRYQNAKHDDDASPLSMLRRHLKSNLNRQLLSPPPPENNSGRVTASESKSSRPPTSYVRSLSRTSSHLESRTRTCSEFSLPSTLAPSPNVPPAPRLLPCHDISRRPLSPPNVPSPSSQKLVPFDTTSLQPQTHKTAHGVITVLPSHSLLVDLRESERKAGKRGDEVITISENGFKIQVFKAPSLSTPCVLSEASACWNLNNLPKDYWKKYRFASRFVDLVRSRTPKLIFLTTRAKCSVMSNIPKPDIELLFPASPSTNAGIQSKPISQPAMRIRLSPKDKTIEISRFAPSSFGASGNGEWTKKIISYAENDDGTLRLNRSQLSTEEKEGLKHLRECRMASEGMQRRLTSQGKQKESPDSTSTVTLSASTKPLNRRTTSSTAQYLSGLKISPRPEKLSPSLKQPPHSATKPTTGDPDLLRAIRSVGIQINNGSSNAPATPSLSSETQYHPPPDTFESEIETRFMPSVGWCMRYQSTARRSGHMYRVMFLDGACLEVDVQRSEATLTLQDGTNRSAHCPIHFRTRIDQPMPTRLKERLAVFVEFAKLF